MMEWLLIILAPICVFPIFIFARLICKRSSLVCRIKSLCKKKGYELIPTHRFWWLGWTEGVNADFHIAAQDTVYSVKLIGVISKRICFDYVDEKNYSVKNMMFQFSQAAFEIPYEPKTKKPYNFDYGLPDKYLDRNRVSVILMNPVSLIASASTFEQRRKRLENGDGIKEGIFYSGNGFTEMLNQDLF